MWFNEGTFYQIYPLGYCGAERVNDFGETRHRFHKIEENIPHLKELGISAVLFNPLVESCTHGYDTVDFYSVDRRLGTNAEFKALVQKLHDNGIKVVLDGVFNHVGREFAPFKAVRQERENTFYKFWFNINFNSNNNYNDGFSYENWEGHNELVKLKLDNWDLQKYLMDAVRFWIDEFDIDGLRLDVSYLLPEWFFELLRRTVQEKKPEFFLMGEVIHIGNFAENITPERLDSITNYECFKGMVSSVNSDNLFEIEYSLTRLFSSVHWALYSGKRLFNFVDNHDVLRAYTALKNKANVFALYTLLFTVPGIPCLYYGSEYAAEGDKSDSDYRLRPFIDDLDKNKHPELLAFLQKLCALRKDSRALAYGNYEKVYLQNRNLVFSRSYEGEKVYACINLDDAPVTVHIGEGEGVNLLQGERVNLSCVTLPPHSGFILRAQ
ncbi:MAG: cyclomaltodextrinase [Clostridia bacterium]|nr:cyclomaltodextrinase [Clostridia bacterium]